jgi:hypothetical protein
VTTRCTGVSVDDAWNNNRTSCVEESALAIEVETEVAGVAGVGTESAAVRNGIVRREATPKSTHDRRVRFVWLIPSVVLSPMLDADAGVRILRLIPSVGLSPILGFWKP